MAVSSNTPNSPEQNTREYYFPTLYAVGMYRYTRCAVQVSQNRKTNDDGDDRWRFDMGHTRIHSSRRVGVGVCQEGGENGKWAGRQVDIVGRQVLFRETQCGEVSTSDSQLMWWFKCGRRVGGKGY